MRPSQLVTVLGMSTVLYTCMWLVVAVSRDPYPKALIKGAAESDCQIQLGSRHVFIGDDYVLTRSSQLCRHFSQLVHDFGYDKCLDYEIPAAPDIVVLECTTKGGERVPGQPIKRDPEINEGSIKLPLCTDSGLVRQ